ncbi:unnamed protein product [Trichobilharzia szidati]|nr:unnamed protein product [Trichobilharzia szidati]
MCRGSGRMIGPYDWMYLGLVLALACAYIIWAVIFTLRIPLSVHIIFAVITNIAVSIICGLEATCLEWKLRLISLVLATVFAVLIFLPAIFTKSFILSNFAIQIICSSLMGIILFILIILLWIGFHFQLLIQVLVGCALVVLAIFIFTIVKFVCSEKTDITTGGSILFASIAFSVIAVSYITILYLFPKQLYC